MRSKIEMHGQLPRYPWDEWLGKIGRSVTIVRGRDFTCQTYAMQVGIRNAARLRGKRVSLRTCEMHDKVNSQEVTNITITVTGRIR